MLSSSLFETKNNSRNYNYNISNQIKLYSSEFNHLSQVFSFSIKSPYIVVSSFVVGLYCTKYISLKNQVSLLFSIGLVKFIDSRYQITENFCKMDNFKNAFIKVEKEYEILQNENQQLKEKIIENQDLKAIIEELKKEIKDANSATYTSYENAVKATLAQHQKSTEVLKEKVNILEQTIKTSKEETDISNAKSIKELKEGHVKILEGKDETIQLLQKMIVSLESSFKDIKNSNAKLIQDLNEGHAKILEGKDETIEHLQKNFDSLESSYKDLKNLNIKLTQDLEQSNKNIKVLVDHRKSEDEKVQRLKEIHESLKNGEFPMDHGDSDYEEDSDIA